jgi:hypothetical protein
MDAQAKAAPGKTAYLTVGQVCRALIDSGEAKRDQIPTIIEALVQGTFARMVERTQENRYAITLRGREFLNGPMYQPPSATPGIVGKVRTKPNPGQKRKRARRKKKAIHASR